MQAVPSAHSLAPSVHASRHWPPSQNGIPLSSSGLQDVPQPPQFWGSDRVSASQPPTIIVIDFRSSIRPSP
jgi:hypothetical protein